MKNFKFSPRFFIFESAQLIVMKEKIIICTNFLKASLETLRFFTNFENVNKIIE